MELYPDLPEMSGCAFNCLPPGRHLSSRTSTPFVVGRPFSGMCRQLVDKSRILLLLTVVLCYGSLSQPVCGIDPSSPDLPVNEFKRITFPEMIDRLHSYRVRINFVEPEFVTEQSLYSSDVIKKTDLCLDDKKEAQKPWIQN